MNVSTELKHIIADLSGTNNITQGIEKLTEYKRDQTLAFLKVCALRIQTQH
jgi:hypothetical protein